MSVKTLEERFTGKSIRMLSGATLGVQSVSIDPEGVYVLPIEGSDAMFIPTSCIEPRGGKFWQKDLNVDQIKTQIKGERKMEDQEKTISCQFCGHEFVSGGGLVKPDSIADICTGCVALAEKRILMDFPEIEITEAIIVEWLTKFYSPVMNNSPVIIKLHTTVSIPNIDENGQLCDDCQHEMVEEALQEEKTLKELLDEDPEFMDACQQAVADILEHEDQENKDNDFGEFDSPESAFLFARRAIAEIMQKIIIAVNGSAAILEETEEGIHLRLDPFDFELTALCGGYLLSAGEDGSLVREESFTSLDDLFAYFCEAPEVEMEYLPLGTFYRLQNCKKEELNKKLVKIIEVIIPEPNDADTPVKYLTEDKEGKRYRVTESKLRVSAKSF